VETRENAIKFNLPPPRIVLLGMPTQYEFLPLTHISLSLSVETHDNIIKDNLSLSGVTVRYPV
jgi:hypothetical protein